MTTHLLRTADTPIDTEWEPIPADYVDTGAPTARTLHLGDFAGGTFGVWDMTEGSSKGAGLAELFVVISGDGELRFKDRPAARLTAGMIAQVANDQYVEFHVTSQVRKFYLTANEDAPYTSEGDTFDMSTELSPIEFFTSEQTNGKTVATSIRELGAAVGANHGVWEMGPGQADWVASDEVFFVTSGRGSLHFEDGDSFDIAAGSVVQTFAGERYQWRVEETVRKYYLSPQAS